MVTRAGSHGTSAEGPATIVLVEDDDGRRDALGRMLEVAGMTVHSFATAEATIDDAPWRNP